MKDIFSISIQNYQKIFQGKLNKLYMTTFLSELLVLERKRKKWGKLSKSPRK